VIDGVMRILDRAGDQHNLLDTVGIHDSGSIGGRAPKAAAIAVVGLAGLTAASAAISSLRRRVESQPSR
jgi:hypothetical protein